MSNEEKSKATTRTATAVVLMLVRLMVNYLLANVWDIVRVNTEAKALGLG
jgi:hypothetical protein